MSRKTGYSRDSTDKMKYTREARRKFLSYISIYVHYSTLKWIKNTLFHIIRGLQKGAIFWKGGQLAPLPLPWLRYWTDIWYTVIRGVKGRRGDKGQKWGKFLAFKYYAIT